MFEQWLIDWVNRNVKNFNISNPIKKFPIKTFEDATLFIDYKNEQPFDSFDRLYALYLLEEHKDIIKKIDINKAYFDKNYANSKCYELLEKEDILDEFNHQLFRLAYDNLERKNDSLVTPFINMITVAQAGKEAILEDSYQNGGYFGVIY